MKLGMKKKTPRNNPMLAYVCVYVCGCVPIITWNVELRHGCQLQIHTNIYIHIVIYLCVKECN